MEKTFRGLPRLDDNFLEKRENFMLFETSLFDGKNSKSYILFDPIDVIKIYRPGDVRSAFTRIEEYSKRYFLAGYFSYELGYSFEEAYFKPKGPYRYPLINLCVFKEMAAFDHTTGMLSPRLPGLFARGQGERDFRVDNPRFNLARREYFRKISRIKRHIINGDTYQVNFTGKYTFGFSGSAFSFYLDLKNKQNVPYGAFCKTGGEYILSLSPELFFRREGDAICSRPMKGTIGRGADIGEDRGRISELKQSAKEIAGNLMIVDLIRNDLGKISETGSVKASSLFEVERYNTLFQMTSTVKSALKEGVTYYDIFRSLFPGGSVTGAPKIKTMQIIRDLEKDGRKVYCGALGIIFPGKKAVFNLPIRTVSISRGEGEMGVGGGITVDSDPEEEYRECALKARFLTERYRPFSLIETVLWEGKFKLLGGHLDRMRDSAAYFGFAFDRAKIKSLLKKTEKGFKMNIPYRVRLLLAKDGGLRAEASKIERDLKRPSLPVAVSGSRTWPGDRFLYHKTTNRELYDNEYKRYRAKGYFDVIFLNTRGEVTEGAITNIVIKKNGRFYTPPLSSGLLPGVYRAHLLKNRLVKVKVLTLNDLRAADGIFLCNSVRGMQKVKVEV